MSKRILVYGAGPLGSIFAAKLQEGGNHVSILARGQRLADLRQHGIVLRNILTGEESVTQVQVIEALGPADQYDLVLVVMRKNHALEILPTLAANEETPNVLFLMNNAAGPGELVDVLGRERVLIGFPNSAGFRQEHVMHCFIGSQEEPVTVPFGEVDGRIGVRIEEVARILASAPGFEAEIRHDMDAWLKYHVALLMPSLVPALYMTGTDNKRLARTRDAVLLAVRAGREGFRVLESLGYPVSPSRLWLLQRLPEPVLVPLLQQILADDKMEFALVKHASAAPDEMKHLADEFLEMARTVSLPMPNIERLYPHFDPETPLMRDGSAEIPLDWSPIWRGLGLAAAALITLGLGLKALRRSS